MRQLSSKKIENLTFDEYIRDMMLRFGAAPAAVEVIWKHPSNNRPQNPRLTPNLLHKYLAHLQEGILKQQLLPGERFQTLSDKFSRVYQHGVELEADAEEGDPRESKDRSYRTVGFLVWTSEVLLGSATRTFFGARLLGIEPELFQKFRYFDNNKLALQAEPSRDINDGGSMLVEGFPTRRRGRIFGISHVAPFDGQTTEWRMKDGRERSTGLSFLDPQRDRRLA